MNNYRDIIIAPVITERSAILETEGKYVFKVDTKANKVQIKQAIEKIFNVKVVVRIMPLLTATGLLIYALIPQLFPSYAYVGLLVGTVIFSVAAGFSEVLLSPMIAAIPSKTPQRDMSFLHSLYAFGVFTVAIITTVFIKVFGAENWLYCPVPCIPPIWPLPRHSPMR